MSGPGQDLSSQFMARQHGAALKQADADLDSLIQDYSVQPPGRPPGTSPQSHRAADDGWSVGKVISGAGAVTKDVAHGAAEAAPQAIGGVLDAIGNAANGLDHLANWMDAHFGGTWDVPSSGNATIDAIGGAILNPLAAVGKLSGAVPEARSVTGGVVREGSKFLTGFIPALRLSKAAGAGPVLAPIAAGAAAGATVLDPQKPNLSAAILEHVTVPASLQPAVKLLATNPAHPEIVNRARNLIENAGFGILTEGVLRGVKAVAAARRAAGMEKAAPEAVSDAADPLAAARAQYGQVRDSDFAPLGDPSKPAVSFQSKEAAAKFNAAAKATDGRVAIPNDDGGSVYINFARIDTPDAVKGVIDRMARGFKGSIDEATRGVQTNEQTKLLADEMGMTVDDLLSRRKGQPFNAEQSLAARRLWTASAEKLVELAERASSPNAGQVDQFNFRKMLAMHNAIQSEVIGARTETARALQAWAIPAKGGVEQARAIQLLLEQNGGEQVAAALAKRIAGLKASGAEPGAINAVIRKGWGATSLDAVREAYVMGLLWSPQTHIVNTMSNSLVAGQQIYERAAAAGISRLRGAGDGVADGEAAAMAFGLISSLKDAFRIGAKSLLSGETGNAIGKVELPPTRAISSDAYASAAGFDAAKSAAFKETGVGKAIDMIGMANGIPGRLLSAEDEFFKTIGYRMELQAQAARQVAAEGLHGKAAAERAAEIISNPPENIRIAAADAALYNTFQNKAGELTQAVLALREKAGPMGWMVLPFVKTPANILAYTFERTPAALLVARWRADIAAGGARRDLALARMATGSAIMSVALDMAENGAITGAGPSDVGQRDAMMRTGWRPYSFKIGDQYVSYNRTDPVAMPLAFAATVAEKFHQSETSPEDLDEWQEALAAAAAVTGEVVVDKTWLTSVSNVISAIQESKRGPGAISNLIAQQAGGMVPFSSAANTAKRFIDPVNRQAMNPYDAILSKTPILSETLPARRDLWGKAIQPDEALGRGYDVLSPIGIANVKDSPIDAEMVRLGDGPERIRTAATFDGVRVNFRDYPKTYDRYVRLAGNELKHPAWGVGAKDFLDAMVKGEGPLSSLYQRFSDEGKANLIKQVVDEYRGFARQEIRRNPDGDEGRAFLDYIDQKKTEALLSRMPQ